MIKIQIFGTEATLDLDKVTNETDIESVWTCDDQMVAQMLNFLTYMRPLVVYDRRPELTIAEFVVDKHKDDGAQIIYDSETGKLPRETDDDAIIY